jgi:processing peptidase subunit alpha
MGASFSAKAGREVFAFTGESLRDGASALTESLVESATELKLFPWEVSEAMHELETVVSLQSSDPVTAVTESVHAAAFGPTSPLGRSMIASAEELHDIDPEAIRAFLGSQFFGSNLVLSATNVDHKDLVKLAENILASVPKGEASSSPKAVVVGGESLIRSDTGGIAHVALALPAPSQSSAHYHALGVLQSLLGGISSRGPPGHARPGYTRQSRISAAVKTEAHSFIRSVTSFAFPYSDAGILGIAGTCEDKKAGHFVNSAVALLKEVVSKPPTASELERAKRAYKLAYLTDVEGRSGSRDESATAILLGRSSGVAATIKAIDAVSADQVVSIVKTALAGSPSISATGSLSTIPRYDVLANLLK